MAQRLQRAYQTVEDGKLTIHIYSPLRDADGKQKVVSTRVYNTADLPDKSRNDICAPKGLGFYMAGRYSSSEDLDPNDISGCCDEVWDEMLKDTFIPGRGAGSGEARPTPFFEALAEHLGLPVHVVQQQVKEDKVKFSPGKLAQIAKLPAIAQRIAKIERERAAAKEKRARDAAKGAEAVDLTTLFDMGDAQAAQ